VAIFLDGQFRIFLHGKRGNTDWTGVLVPNVTVEIDEFSLLDPSQGQPQGALVRNIRDFLSSPNLSGRGVLR